MTLGRVVLVVLALCFIAGCTSTVVLGTLSLDAGDGVDLARARFDASGASDGGDFGGDLGGGTFDGGGDAAALVDLAL